MNGKESTCYDCKRRMPRSVTVWATRVNTQGKGARVRVCMASCPATREAIR